MPQTLIYISDEDNKQLELLRQQSNIKSKSDFIIKIISEYLDKSREKKK